jgi:hypothetical protein
MTDLYQVMACLITRCYPALPPWPERIKIHVDSFQDPGDSDDDDDDDDQDDNNDGDSGNGNNGGGRVRLRGGGFGARVLDDWSPPWTGGWTKEKPFWPQPNNSQGSEGGDTILNSSPAAWTDDDAADDMDDDGGDVEQDGDGEDLEPSVPEELDKSSDGGDLDDGELRVWSYGGYLLRNNERWRHVDYYLRKLVAQCLCDNPMYRPRLAWLEHEVWQHMQPDSDDDEDDDGDDGDDDGGDGNDGNGGNGDDEVGRRAYSNAQIRRWIRRCWGEPSAERRERLAQEARDRRARAN